MNLIWDAFWLFLPAGVANISPMFAARLPLLRNLSTPMDFGNTFRGKPVFGKNKTWRGIFFGSFTAGLVGLIQYKVIGSSDIPAFYIFIPAFAMGWGALVGDAVESFFKRQRGVKSGGGWFPFDQIDYIIGGLLFAYPFYMPSFKLILTIFILYTGLHIAGSYIGYLLKMKPSII